MKGMILMEEKNKNLKIYSSAILFSLIVGFSFLAVKVCVKWATPLETLTYRFNFAFLGSLIPVILGLIKIEIAGKPKKNIMLTAGFYLGFMLLQTIGLLYASSIESGIIFAIIPILTKIFARFLLGEKGNWKQNLFVGITVASVVAMFVFSVQDYQAVSITGLVILFLSSISMAVSNVYMRHTRHEYGPYAITFAITASGCVVFNIATLAFGLTTGTLSDYFAPLANAEFIYATAFLGIPSTFITSVIMAYMLANMEAVKATVFGNLSTAISIVVGIIILSEPFHAYHIICTTLIIIGVIGTSKNGNDEQEDLKQEIEK
jgi:drug/metabolite transporter (DMT)-like permease